MAQDAWRDFMERLSIEDLDVIIAMLDKYAGEDEALHAGEIPIVASP